MTSTTYVAPGPAAARAGSRVSTGRMVPVVDVMRHVAAEGRLGPVRNHPSRRNSTSRTCRGRPRRHICLTEQARHHRHYSARIWQLVPRVVVVARGKDGRKRRKPDIAAACAPMFSHSPFSPPPAAHATIPMQAASIRQPAAAPPQATANKTVRQLPLPMRNPPLVPARQRFATAQRKTPVRRGRRSDGGSVLARAAASTRPAAFAVRLWRQLVRGRSEHCRGSLHRRPRQIRPFVNSRCR
jgi:hypothetical protein